MKISLKENVKYSRLTNDLNKIHLSSAFASSYFVKKPICHGTNVALKVLKHCKIKKISGIQIIFNNFITCEEEFFFKKFKKKIIIFNHEKKITIKYDLKTKYFSYIKLKSHLNSISSLAGNYLKDKLPSIILDINLEYHDNDQLKIKFDKIQNNIFKLNLFRNNIKSKTLFAKIKPKPFTKNNKTKRYKKSRGNILIFGKNSDLGNFTYNYLTSKGYKVKYFEGYFKNLQTANSLLNIYLNKKIDYIFYFLTKKIIPFEKNYDFENFKIFRIICKFFSKKNVKIFYPSSKFIEINQPQFQNYIQSKLKAEKFINSYKNKKIKYYRLPQLKTSQTYSLFKGFQGQDIQIMTKYLDEFISE